VVTTKFPDVSNHNYPLSLSGAPIVIAKATQGTGFKDAYYTYYKSQADAMRAPFMGYHWMDTSDLSLQAKNAFSVVGPNVPLMWDAEDAGVTVPRLLDLTDRYRSLGGIVHMLYLPKWYWVNHMGSPDLSVLAADGLYLISSHYTAYSDTGPGWQPYGGMTPVQWQYTNSQAFNGKFVDFNAYKGTPEQYYNLITGGAMALTQADIDAIVNGVFAKVVNAVSLGYSAPFSEYVKYIKQNSVDISSVSQRVDEILALIEAGGGNGVTPEQVKEIVDNTILGSSITPGE
jgi:Glycosyl hydrolases family 25